MSADSRAPRHKRPRRPTLFPEDEQPGVVPGRRETIVGEDPAPAALDAARPAPEADPADPRDLPDLSRIRPPKRGLFDTLSDQQRIDRLARETRIERHKDQRLQSLIEGAAVFVLTELLLFGLSFWSLPILILIGAATGWAAHVLRAQRGRAALLAFTGLLLTRSLVGLAFAYYDMIYLMVGICLFVGARIPRESESSGW
jgi:hypothetical protein